MDRAINYQLAVLARDHAMVMQAAAVAAAAVWLWVARPRLAQPAPGRIPGWWLVAVVVAGSVARLAPLAIDQLWYDESFTAAVSRLPLARAWVAIAEDVHPPGWYLIEAPFVALGRAEWLARLPAALFSIAALALLAWWIRRARLPAVAGVVAMVLMALAPVQLRYAAEARMYAALSFCGVAILVGLQADRPWLLGLGLGLAPWLQHCGWLYVAIAVAFWVYRRSTIWPAAPNWGRLWRQLVRDRRQILASAGPILAPIGAGIPALGLAIRQLMGSSGLGPGLLESGYWIHDRSAGAWLYHAVFHQVFSANVVPEGWEWPAGILAIAALGLVLLGGIRRRSWGLLALALGPGLLLWGISLVGQPMLLHRVLIGSTPAWYILVGQGVAQVRWPRRWWMGGLALAAMAVLVGPDADLALGGARGTITPLYQAAQGCRLVIHSEPSTIVLGLAYGPDLQQALWADFEPGRQAGALSRATEMALGIQRASLAAADCLIYADHAMVPRENLARLDQWLDGRQPAFVLVDDDFSFIALYRW